MGIGEINDDAHGITTPRIFTPPLRELTPETSNGYAVIEFAEKFLHVHLFPWQKWLLIHGLELLPDGSYRFRRVVTEGRAPERQDHAHERTVRVVAVRRLRSPPGVVAGVEVSRGRCRADVG